MWYYYDFIDANGRVVKQIIQRGKLAKYQQTNVINSLNAEHGKVTCKLVRTEK